MSVPPKQRVALLRREAIPESPSHYTRAGLRAVTDFLAETIGLCVDLRALCAGKRVLLKPNLVRPDPRNPQAIVTDERVVLGLVSLCRDAGAREVWVGDNPGYGLSLAAALSALGRFKEGLRRAGATLRYFDAEETVRLDNPEAVLFDPIVVPKALLEAEVYINVPKLKTHVHTLMTAGVKNQYGLVLDDQRMFCHRNDINLKVTDILRVIRPHVTVVDAIYAVQGQAPLSGSVVADCNVLVCGTDTAAVDTVCAQVMGFDPMEVPMLRIIRSEGLGETDPDRIEVVGMAVAAVARPFRRPIIGCMGAYPEIFCLEGGACQGCLSALRHALDKLHAAGELSGRAVQTVYVGEPMPGMGSPRRIRGELWCFGDCAAKLLENADTCRENAHCVPGCPPHILDFYKAYLARYTEKNGSCCVPKKIR
ncbi:MAG: DUF362 domain-containing protein [Solidesulfovibrio sp. DCME]|uniref:DUF362 domain-containing protein n=1 Tax=Solidesulfovibrio sp. DCME TaxID=3447380 RepID=UPI003D0973D0